MSLTLLHGYCNKSTETTSKISKCILLILLKPISTCSMVKQFHLNDHCDLIGQNCGLSGLKKILAMQSSRPATCCSLFSALITLQDFIQTDSNARVSIQLNKWSLCGYNDPKLPKSHFQVTGPLRGLLFLMQNTGY